MAKQAARALVSAVIVGVILATAALGCEHPAEYDDTAEARWAVDATDENRPDWLRERAEPQEELVVMPMPGPRTSTPSGVASGLHREGY